MVLVPIVEKALEVRREEISLLVDPEGIAVLVDRVLRECSAVCDHLR